MLKGQKQNRILITDDPFDLAQQYKSRQKLIEVLENKSKTMSQNPNTVEQSKELQKEADSLKESIPSLNRGGILTPIIKKENENSNMFLFIIAAILTFFAIK